MEGSENSPISPTSPQLQSSFPPPIPRYRNDQTQSQFQTSQQSSPAPSSISSTTKTTIPTTPLISRSNSLTESSSPPSPILSALIQTTLLATSSPLQHFAPTKSTHTHSRSSSNINSNRPSLSPSPSPSSQLSSQNRISFNAQNFRPLSTTFEEQRHNGSGISITSSTRIWDPDFSAPSRESLKSEWRGSWGDERSRTLVGSVVSSRKEFPLERCCGNGKVKMEGVGQRKETAEGGGGGVEGEEEEEDENVYPGPFALTCLIVGIALSVFLISLDRTIITTAIPFITAEFDSSSEIGWYGSSYLLTASAFQPLYGRIFTLFNMKWSYLAALGMFELGSFICGIAPNSVTLIVGRSLAGLGSAGILTGSFVVVSNAVPLERRPVLTAVVGLMFGVGATVGPLLGGVFTDLVTWRWCFYFNLPVGGATALALLFFFHPPKNHVLMGQSFIYRVAELDLVGNIILLGAAIMLFLALQFTEEHVPWRSAEVIGLLAGCSVTFGVFCAWMWWKADAALIPPRIIGQRTVAASCVAAFFIYSTILIHTYYLPMWFQAIRGDSAVHSGVNMIPYVAANAVFSLLAGIFVSKNGYFTAPAIVGCAIGTVGCGLLSTINEHTPSSMWIGYEFLASVGIGMAIQQGFTAVQIVLPSEEVAIGTAAIVAFQSLGGAIFVSVGNTILQNSLLNAEKNNRLPGVDVQAVIDAGAAEFRKHVTAQQLPALLNVYSRALQKVFTAAIPMAGLAMISCLFLEWRNVKDKKKVEDLERAKARKQREDTEKRVLEVNRGDRYSGSSYCKGWNE